MATQFHPHLKFARFIPEGGGGDRAARLARKFKVPAARVPDDLVVDDVMAPGWDGGPRARLRLYRVKDRPDVTPALLWLHGGGFMMGNVEQDDRRSMAIARELGITVAAVSYRLAPEHPAPAALHDAYACLRYLHEAADDNGIDRERIAIGGTSAGGGLTASLALLAHDLGDIRPVFQLMSYPVLDDRTVSSSRQAHPKAPLFGVKAQEQMWRLYLGHEPGGPEVDDYAAPGRRTDLSGLPPAWIGVATHDVLYEEGVAYAERLKAHGVPCELYVVEGAFHGFDVLYGRTAVSRAFRAAQRRALHGALFPGD